MKLYLFSAKELFGEEEVKCSWCNWSTSRVFVLAESKGKAIKVAKKTPFCGSCIAEIIATGNYKIVENKHGGKS